MKINTLTAAISTVIISYGATAYAGGETKNERLMKGDKHHQTSNEMKGKHHQSFQSYSDGSTVTLTGTVQKVDGHDFVMRHGRENIEVELEGWNWNKPDLEKHLKVGQRVTVTGEVDDDWFDEKELEAQNIYLDTEQVYFYTVDINPAYVQATRDVEKRRMARGDMQDGSYYSVRGDIKKIDGDDIVLAANNRNYRVNLDELGYNPLDNQGLQRLSVGDRVWVSGEIDDNFFDGKEIDADVIVSINRMNNDSMASN